MKLLALLGAGAMAATAIVGAAPASAQYYHGHHYARGWHRYPGYGGRYHHRYWRPYRHDGRGYGHGYRHRW